jgi:hypothetical protein
VSDPPVFGRRALRTVAPPAFRASSAVDLPAWVAYDPRSEDDRRLIVPFRMRAVVLAAMVAFGVQLAASWARNSNSAFAGAEAGLAAAWTPALVWLEAGAIYVAVAHAALRWLRMTSPLVYALGGAGVVYVYVALAGLAGAAPDGGAAVIELSGAALAGFTFRFASGLVEASPAPADPLSDEQLVERALRSASDVDG